MSRQSMKAENDIAKALETKKAELKELEKTIKTMSPWEKAEAELKMERLAELIGSLESAVGILEQETVSVPEEDVLTHGLDGYLEEKENAVSIARDAVIECQEKLGIIQRDLDQAVIDGNYAAIETLTAELDSEKRKLPYLKESYGRIQQMKAIPDGAVKAEWLKICDQYQEEWDIRVETVKALAMEYKKACNDLQNLRDTLFRIRGRLQSIGHENGCSDFIQTSVIAARSNKQNANILEKDDVSFLCRILGMNDWISGGRNAI